MIRNGHRVRRGPGRFQGQALLALGLLAGLAGCSDASSLNPVDWWHNLEGGAIAEQRPPPPNDSAPFPNLAQVPQRPTNVTPPPTRDKISSGLVADRTNAQYAAALAPLAPPPPRPTPATPPPAEMNASLPAATAPPASPLPSPLGPPQPPLPDSGAPPRPAPVGAVQSSPLAAPPAPEVTAAAAPMAAVPAAPPPPPDIAGVPTATVPVPPPTAPPPAPQPPPAPGAPVSVAFAPGSAALSSDAQAPLRQLARTRGNAAISVTGFGGAAGADPATQSAALPLAWQRARAIAGVLQQAGVPEAQLRVTAQAQGQGGVAAIVQ